MAHRAAARCTGLALDWARFARRRDRRSHREWPHWSTKSYASCPSCNRHEDRPGGGFDPASMTCGPVLLTQRITHRKSLGSSALLCLIEFGTERREKHLVVLR